MLGDVLLIEEKHKQAAAAIQDHIMAGSHPKFIAAISGESGSGKSELAHCLGRALKESGIRAKLIHSDNYYLTLPAERNEWRKAHGAQRIGPDEYDWNLLEQTLDDFRQNRTSQTPCIDLITDQVDTLTTDFSEIDMLILDGLYAIAADGADLRVFIDLTYHETKKAQLLRGKEEVNEWRMTVLEQEHRAVRALKQKAGLIVTGSYQVEPA
ncbi:MAG: uridine kinase [Thermodesulfobacteriota bacterium]|nr:uridine kinase [Thermodesulfobacteriota bacterium]